MKGLKDKIDVASIGLEMGGCVAVGWLVGTWLDERFGPEPWALAFMLICGFGAATKGLVRVARKAQAACEAPTEHGNSGRSLEVQAWTGGHSL